MVSDPEVTNGERRHEWKTTARAEDDSKSGRRQQQRKTTARLEDDEGNDRRRRVIVDEAEIAEAMSHRPPFAAAQMSSAEGSKKHSRLASLSFSCSPMYAIGLRMWGGGDINTHPFANDALLQFAQTKGEWFESRIAARGCRNLNNEG
jgi:hypothetical protein